MSWNYFLLNIHLCPHTITFELCSLLLLCLCKIFAILLSVMRQCLRKEQFHVFCGLFITVFAHKMFLFSSSSVRCCTLSTSSSFIVKSSLAIVIIHCTVRDKPDRLCTKWIHPGRVATCNVIRLTSYIPNKYKPGRQLFQLSRE